MSLVIAETTHITRQDSGLAAVDVYEEVTNTPVNAGITKSGIGEDILGPNVAGELSKLGDVFGDFENSSLKDIVGRVTEFTKNKDTHFKNLKEAILKDTLNNVGLGDHADTVSGVLTGDRDPSELIGIATAASPDIKVLVDGVEQLRSIKDVDSIEEMVGLLTEFTGNEEFIKITDLGMEFAAFSTILKKATNLRIPEIVDIVLNEVDDKQKRKLLVTSAPTMARDSDIQSLYKVVDVLGEQALRSVYPDTVATLLKSYRTLDGNPPTIEDSNQLITLLDKIDSNWLYTTRGNKTVYKLANTYMLSEHARLALSLNEETVILVALTGLYPISTIKDVLAETKPWVKLVS